MTEPTPAPRSVLWLNQLDPGHPWAGGAERHIEEVGRRLVAQGTRVTVVGERFRRLPTEEWRAGIRILRPVRRGLLHAWVLANARRLVEQYDVDVVVGDLSKILPWGRRSLGDRPLVTIVRHFNARQVFQEAPFPTGPVLWAVERFAPLVLRSSTIVTESCDSESVLLRLGARPDSIRRIPPGVDTDRFRPDAAARSKGPLVAYVGRLKRYKRLDLALRAFADALDRWPGARFEIAGAGSDRDRLAKLSRELGLTDSVRFLGMVPTDDVVRLYQRAWVHVQPSSAEGWGLTALESLACGTPVVAFAGGSLAETVGPLCRDLLAESPTAESLADALARGLDRGWEADPTASSALVDYARSFSWDATAARYATMLGGVAAGTTFSGGAPTAVPAPSRRTGTSAARPTRGLGAPERVAEPSVSP